MAYVESVMDAHPWFDAYARAGAQNLENLSDRDRVRGGLQGLYKTPIELGGEKLCDFTMFVQGSWAEYGPMTRGGFESFFSCKIPLPATEHGGREWFTAITPFYGFDNMQEHGVYSYPTDSRTWDRKANHFGFLFDITKNIMLKCEWSVYEESIGALVEPTWVLDMAGNRFSPDNHNNGDPDNDELVVQLEVSF